MRFKFEGTLQEFRALIGRGEESFDASDPLEASSYALQGYDPPLGEVLGDEENVIPMTGIKSVVPPHPPETATPLGQITEEERVAGFAHFKSFCESWCEGFGIEGAEQVDRETLMQELGRSRWVRAILILAYEEKSLQSLVAKAVAEKRAAFEEEGWWDFVDQLSCNLVQVSHRGFPELAGAYDYSTRWRRRLENE